jgi:ACS family hexuronate transporter-like MFS transporter
MESVSRSNSTTDGSRWVRNLIAGATIYGLGSVTLHSGDLFSRLLYMRSGLSPLMLRHSAIVLIPVVVGIAGYLFFGRLADRLRERAAERPWRPGTFYLWLAIAGFVLTLAPLSYRTMGWFVVHVFFTSFTMLLGGGYVVFALSDGIAMLPKRRIAFFAGICTFASNLISIVTTGFIPNLFREYRLVLAFVIVAFLPLLGTIIWWVLARPSRPVSPAESNS